MKANTTEFVTQFHFPFIRMTDWRMRAWPKGERAGRDSAKGGERRLERVGHMAWQSRRTTTDRSTTFGLACLGDL